MPTPLNSWFYFRPALTDAFHVQNINTNVDIKCLKAGHGEAACNHILLEKGWRTVFQFKIRLVYIVTFSQPDRRSCLKT